MRRQVVTAILVAGVALSGVSHESIAVVTSKT